MVTSIKEEVAVGLRNKNAGFLKGFIGDSCSQKSDCVHDYQCMTSPGYADKTCQLDPARSDYNQWYHGSCIADGGRSENLGNGLSEADCLTRCKKQPFTACEHRLKPGWSTKKECYRHTQPVTGTSASDTSDARLNRCYIPAPAIPRFQPWLAKSCTSNAACKAHGEGLYCAVKNSRVTYSQLKGQARCALADDCCKNLDSIEGKCPMKCQNMRVGSSWYKPVGMNRYIGGRPRREGATSYDIETAMARCNDRGDCNGITCNVNNQGWKRCELRRNTDSGFHNRGDCQACLSYHKKSTMYTCNLAMEGEAAVNCKYLKSDTCSMSQCEWTCISDPKCNAFTTDSSMNHCFLYECPTSSKLESGPSGKHANYMFYSCFDLILGAPDLTNELEETVGYFTEAAASEVEVSKTAAIMKGQIAPSQSTRPRNVGRPPAKPRASMKAAVATPERDGASLVVYGFAAVGLGFLLYGAGKHYSKGSTEHYSTGEA